MEKALKDKEESLHNSEKEEEWICSVFSCLGYSIFISILLLDFYLLYVLFSFVKDWVEKY